MSEIPERIWTEPAEEEGHFDAWLATKDYVPGQALYISAAAIQQLLDGVDYRWENLGSVLATQLEALIKVDDR